jgi:serine/threonine protein kinase/WD40 repeat protein
MSGDDRETNPTSGRPPDTPLPPADDTAGHGIEGVRTRLSDAVPAPHRVGPYAVIKTLGRGGMGTVYLARDEQVGREVALKVIPAGPDADPNDLARFRTEAEAVARLDHPNIVKLFDVGEGDGLAWLAMEYVDGGSLYRKIKADGPLNPALAAELVEQVARAAHYAHTRGVVHRDLKPSNILLANDQFPMTHDQSGRTLDIGHWSFRPKVADFGLAKQLDRSLRLTQTGTAIGTPNYMAPEQARGLNEQVGPPADVHAIGAILYELLTGHPPFGGASPLETMEQVVHKKAVPPSHLRNGIPPFLEAICLKCLEKSPGRRFQTAAELADALHAYRTGPSDVSRPAGYPAVRDHVWWYRLGAVAAGGLLLAVLAGTAAWLLTGRAHRADVQTAREQADTATRAERRARLEAAIALCERGQVALGLERMRTLEGDETFPVRALIQTWETRLLRRSVAQPTVSARVVALSPRADRLAAVSGNTIHVLWVIDAQPQGEPWPVDAEVTALAWSEDGERLAVGTADGRVLLGSVSGRRFTSEPVLKDLGRAVAAITWTGPGVRYTLAGDARPGEQAADGSIGPVVATAISPVSTDSAAVTENGRVRLYDAADRLWRDLPADGDASAVAYASDGNVLAVGTRGGAVRVWDAVGRTPLTDAVHIGSSVTALAVAAAGREYVVIACPADGPAVVLRCGRPFHAPPIRLANGPGQEVIGVAFTPHRTGLYVTTEAGVSLWRYGEGGRYVRVRDYSAAQRYAEPTAGKFAACSVCGASDEAPGSLLIGGSAGRVFRVDPETGNDLGAASLAGGGDVTGVAITPDGGRVCACGKGKGRRSVLRHWASGFAPGPAKVSTVDCGINHQAFLPDGSALVLGCDDGKVRVWDPVTGSDVRPPLDCGSPVLAVAVSDDGRRALAGCADGSARLWDLGAGTTLVTVRHRAEVRSVAFYQGELMTASGDGTARRWHAGTGLPLGPAMPHEDALTALAVWKDLAATGGRDRYVRVWRLN